MFKKEKNGLTKYIDDKGLSLVELIVVIAIMAVMIGAGGFTISMLSGAEAKQAVQKFYAQLNDVKTGTMTKAAEEMIIRYIEVNDANKESYAKKGVDSSGYYADKCVYTIMNNENTDSSRIKTAYADTHEYTKLASKKVSINVKTSISDDNELDDTGAKGYLFAFNRRTGAFEEVSNVSVSGETLAVGSSLGELVEVTFKCGLKTYTLEVNSDAGTYKIK